MKLEELLISKPRKLNPITNKLLKYEGIKVYTILAEIYTDCIRIQKIPQQKQRTHHIYLQKKTVRKTLETTNQ